MTGGLRCRRRHLPDEKIYLEDQTYPIGFYEKLGFWWTGFYLVKGGVLVLGPFQEPVACSRIPFGRGVCGTAWQRRASIAVPDVDKFPGHIACSSMSRSEAVVPIFRGGEVSAVLDIDSSELGTFDEVDIENLEKIANSYLLYRELSRFFHRDIEFFTSRHLPSLYSQTLSQTSIGSNKPKSSKSFHPPNAPQTFNP